MLTSINAASAAYAGGMKTSAAGGTAAGNLAALQAALNTGRVVHIPYGVYPLAPGARKRASGQRVFGQGQRQTILMQQGSGDLFHSAGYSDTGIEDLQVNGDPEQVSGFVYNADGSVRYGSSTSQAGGGYLRNVLMVGCWDGVNITDVNNIDLESIEMLAMRGDTGINAWADTNRRIDLIGIRNVTYSADPITRATRGTALSIDGCVQTVEMRSFRAVQPHRGIVVRNSPNMPQGQAAAFLLGDMVQIDFPVMDAISVSTCSRFRLLNSYLHGSQLESGLVLGEGARNVVVEATNITGNAKSAIYAEAKDLDIIAVQLDWNGQSGYAVHHGILLGPQARRVRVVAGGATETQVAYGIWKHPDVPAGDVLLSATEHHVGIYGNKNW